MSGVVEIPIADLAPSEEEVLLQQGVPRGAEVRSDVHDICARSLELLLATALPVGITESVSPDDFASVFAGEGRNEEETPVGEIYRHAKHLLLFAVTLGEDTSSEIDRLFQTNDFALGCMLDAAASVAADRAAERVERDYADSLVNTGWDGKRDGALRYSPGYCGWHISGQKRLFGYLKPERIGLTLRDSYLMEPMKSVSGVVLAGPMEMHEFEPTYPSCASCETANCRDRIRALHANRAQ